MNLFPPNFGFFILFFRVLPSGFFCSCQFLVQTFVIFNEHALFVSLDTSFWKPM
jgi:hypothetical protein